MVDMNTRPAVVSVGDRIAFDVIAGYLMRVEEVAPCPCPWHIQEAEGHDQYRVTDVMGGETWVCGYDVHNPFEGC